MGTTYVERLVRAERGALLGTRGHRGLEVEGVGVVELGLEVEGVGVVELGLEVEGVGVVELGLDVRRVAEGHLLVVHRDMTPLGCLRREPLDLAGQGVSRILPVTS